MSIKSFIGNPILSPKTEDPWQSLAVFNGCPIKYNSQYYLLYRAMGQTDVEGQKLALSTIGIAEGSDKTNFTQTRQFIRPEMQWEKFGCEDPRVTFIDNRYLIFYTAISGYPIKNSDVKVALAISPNLNTITEKHLITPFNAKAMSLFPEKINGDYTAIFTYGTESGDSHIALASFSEISDLWSPEYWLDWQNHLDHHQLHLGRLNTDRVEVGAPPIEIDIGWLLIYSHIQNYYSSSKVFGIEVVIIDRHQPNKILYRTNEPLMIPQENYELQGMVPNTIFPSGCLLENHQLYIYYGAADTHTAIAVINLADLIKKLRSIAPSQTKLTKYQNNPILKPNNYYPWQAKSVFNPTVFHHQGNFHLIFRALSSDNTSVFGYARSGDGYNIDYIHPTPIYTPRLEFESKKNPNNGSGCEDPRITLIDDKLYLLYTAYNGVDPPGIAMSSILLADFLANRWLNWSPPVLISEPGVDDKDACLLPEKINGKYAIFHRPFSKGICVDLVDNLEFGHGLYLKSDFCLSLNFNRWDNLKTGIAGVPIKTTKGWLVIYHAINKFDHYYRIGALLLDLNDLTKLVGKIDNPILEPEHEYERRGIYDNVVFPCGHVVVDGRLFVYYGAADSCIAVATAPLDSVLDSVVYSSSINSSPPEPPLAPEVG